MMSTLARGLLLALFLFGSGVGSPPAVGGAPDAATLGVPIYPGARYDPALSRFYAREHGERTKTLAAFTTRDSLEKVAAYYRNNLKNPPSFPSAVWFLVGTNDLSNYLRGFSIAAYATADVKKKLDALEAANSGKMYQRVEQSLGRNPEVQIKLNRPYLSSKVEHPNLGTDIDLVDQTVIEILVFEKD